MLEVHLLDSSNTTYPDFFQRISSPSFVPNLTFHHLMHMWSWSCSHSHFQSSIFLIITHRIYDNFHLHKCICFYDLPQSLFAKNSLSSIHHVPILAVEIKSIFLKVRRAIHFQKPNANWSIVKPNYNFQYWVILNEQLNRIT